MISFLTLGKLYKEKQEATAAEGEKKDDSSAEGEKKEEPKETKEPMEGEFEDVKK